MGNDTSHPRPPFQRVRRAPLASGFGSFLPGFLFFVAVVCIQTALFVFLHHLSWKLVAAALLPGVVSAAAMMALEAGLVLVKGRLEQGWGALLSGFVLFFLHLIGYLVLSSLLVASPMGWFFRFLHPGVSAAQAYGLFSADIFLLLGAASWLRKLASNRLQEKRQRTD